MTALQDAITCGQDQATPADVRSLLSEDQDTPKACLAFQMFHNDVDFQAGSFEAKHILGKITGGNLFEEQDGGLILLGFIFSKKIILIFQEKRDKTIRPDDTNVEIEEK